MSELIQESLIIFLLLIANGVFAMAEISMVSARKARLKALADAGSAKARAALALAEEPTRFLSTVQIGITLIGILAGAFGGARLTQKVAVYLEQIPFIQHYAEAVAMVLVVGTITFVSLVVGELVPKRVGLNNPENKAMFFAGPMSALSKVASPVVWLLTATTQVILKSLGMDTKTEAPPSEEEVSHLIEQGTTAGVFHRSERAMVEGVLRLDERPVTELMTRRTKLIWLNAQDADDTNWRKIVASGHSQFPVYEGTRDNVLGLVSVKALWANAAFGLSTRLKDHVAQPLMVPASVTAVQLLETFKRTRKHVALVMDEFGVVQGMVTLHDVMEAIVGDMPEPGARPAAAMLQRDDGSWLIDGEVDLEDLWQRLGTTDLGEEAEGYTTLAGLVMDRLGRIPTEGDTFAYGGWRFEVIDMDRHKVDKVIASRVKLPTTLE